MIRRILSIALTLTAMFATIARASDIASNAGTSGAQFLKLGAGARSTAMGEAFVGIADDINSLKYNPAGLNNVHEVQLMATHTDWLQDLSHNWVGAIMPTKIGNLGFSAVTLSVKDIQKYGTDESSQGDFTSLDAAYQISYGNKFTDRFFYGVTGRYISEEIDSASAHAWGGDLGLFYKFSELPVSLGFAARNLGSSVKFDDEGDPQPLTFDTGVGAKFFNNRLITGFNIVKARDDDAQFGFGTEWTQSLGENLAGALRAGYNSTATDADGASGISMGAGLRYKKIDFDFSYLTYGDLGNTFKYTVTFRP